jgi:hypothetical protein
VDAVEIIIATPTGQADSADISLSYRPFFTASLQMSAWPQDRRSLCITATKLNTGRRANQPVSQSQACALIASAHGDVSLRSRNKTQQYQLDLVV